MRFLDSDFLIGVLRGEPGVKKMFSELLDEEAATTSINEFEIMFGAFYCGRGQELAEAKKLFSELEVFSFDREAAHRAADIHSQLAKKGEKIDIKDLLIASIVLENSGILVTRNTKHFRRIKSLKIQEW